MLRGNFFVKSLAFLLFTAMVLVFVVSLVGSAYLVDDPEIKDKDNYFQTDNCKFQLRFAAQELENMWQHMTPSDARQYWMSMQRGWMGDVYYIVCGKGGAGITAFEEDPRLELAGHIHTYEGEDYTVKTYVYRDMDYSLRGVGLNKLMFDFSKTFGDWLFAACFASAVLGLACFVFLCFAAGHRRGAEGIVLNLIDKIPYDIYAAFCFGVGVFGCLAVESIYYALHWDIRVALMAMAIFLAYLMAYSFIMTSVTRIKAGKFWENTLIWRLGGWLLRRGWKYSKIAVLWCWKWTKIICRKCAAPFGKIFSSMGEVMDGLPFVLRGALVLAAIAFINILLCLFTYLFDDNIITFLLIFGTDLGLLWAGWKLLIDMDKLKKAGEYLAAGDTEFTVDTAKMLGDFRQHGENLNSIGQGISRAVDRQLKSERLKTELITNVSHDIKTPLTSIVNYVDLLKKEELDGKAKEYVDVLDRQSARLKKLTEDLVEASKASTGNMTVNLSRTDVGEIARQSAGEYAERLQKAKLELVTNIPDPAPHIMADGRLLWRIIDNLLSNVCKYSQPGTRVYLDIRRMGGKVSLSVKNISRDMLNIDPEELTERFVRGDMSRNTEGSGLGLNIARSLTELQNGSFELNVDGDLFKAQLQFNEIG